MSRLQKINTRLQELAEAVPKVRQAAEAKHARYTAQLIEWEAEATKRRATGLPAPDLPRRPAVRLDLETLGALARERTELWREREQILEEMS